MSEKNLSVYFTGPAPGQDPKEVQKNLARGFKTTPDKVAHFFKGGEVLVRKGLDKPTAAKYKKMLEQAGGRCKVKMSGAAGAQAKPAAPKAPKGFACPKCGFEQPESPACQRCGVVFSKLKAREEPPAEPMQPPPPPPPPGPGFGAADADEAMEPPPGMTGVRMVSEIDDREPINFFAALPGAFVYPLKGNGLFIVAGGAVFFYIIGFIPMGGLIRLLFWGYYWAYMFKVINTTADGAEEPPHWPGLTDLGEEILAPLLKVVFAGIFSFLPALIVLYLSGFNTVDPLFLTLLVGGALYYPMALLAVAMSGNFLLMNPLTVLPAIVKTLPDYAVAAALFLVLIGVRSVLSGVASAVPFVGGLLTWFVALFVVMVEMRILGLIYAANFHKLEWYED